MFPTVWYAPTFFSRTYWPRPSVRIHDAMRTDFVTVIGEDQIATIAESGITVTADEEILTVDTVELIPVPASDFVLVD